MSYPTLPKAKEAAKRVRKEYEGSKRLQSVSLRRIASLKVHK